MYHIPPRRTVAPSLSCRAIPYWRCVCNNSSALPRRCWISARCACASARSGLGTLFEQKGHRPPLEHSAFAAYLYHRAVRSYSLYISVLSHTCGAIATTPAHARAAAELLRGAHAPALVRAVAHYSGLRVTISLSNPAPSPHTTHRCAVRSRPLYLAVPSRTGERVQTTLMPRSRPAARHLFEDSPSFSTTRTCVVSNIPGAAAAMMPSSADIGSNDGYSI